MVMDGHEGSEGAALVIAAVGMLLTVAIWARLFGPWQLAVLACGGDHGSPTSRATTIVIR